MYIRLVATLRVVAYTLPLLFLALFFLYPLAAILRLSFVGLEGAGSGLAALVEDTYYLRVIWFSTWQAALSTVLTLAIGLPAAYVFARYEFPGKTLLRAIATVPFVLPTVVVATAFMALLGPSGLLNTTLQALLGLDDVPIRASKTIGLMLLAHVFYNYSVVLRVVGGFWSTLDTRLEQAAAVLGATRARVFREVTLPLLLPAIGAAALLIFIFTFASFGVVLLLGNPRRVTVEVEIYRQTAQLLHLDVAAALALVQMLATLLMTVLYTRIQARAAVPLERGARTANTRRVRGTRAGLLVAGNIAILLLLFGAPMAALILRSLLSPASDSGAPSLRYYQALSVNQTGSLFFVPPLTALRNSLVFALAATALALLIGIPLAYLLTKNQEPRTKNQPTKNQEPRTKNQRTKNQEPRTKNQPAWIPVLSSQFSVLGGLLDPLVMLPLGTSAVTLGLGYLITLGRPPLDLLRSPLLVPVAHALLGFPFVVRSLLPALRGLDPRQREAARMLGAGPLRLLRDIDLPLLFPALLVGAVFAFTVSIGEFGATLLLYRPDYPTVPVVIERFLGQPGDLNFGQALALSTVMLLTTGFCFVLIERVRYRDIGTF